MRGAVSKNKGLRGRLTFFLRLSVSVALVWIILTKIEWIGLVQVVQNTTLFHILVFIILSILLTFLLIWVSCLRWQILLATRQIRIPMVKLFGLYVIGYFFNNLLPSNVGGDVVRTYELRRYTSHTSESVASVFLERFVGASALVFMAALSLIINWTLFSRSPLFWVIIGILGAYGGGVWLIFDRRALKAIMGRISIKALARIGSKLKEVHDSIYRFREDKGVIARTFLLSILYNILAILNVQVCFFGLNIPVPLWDTAVAVPIVLLVAMLPISLGGLGLNEGAYVYVYSLFGIVVPLTFSAALLLRAQTILTGALGGVFYGLQKRGTPRLEQAAKEVQPELQQDHLG
ncbi:glycosyltransferase 2 family protein [Candidatus Hakubella thermalkaliphila]|uniref:Glycosyltransferase 2 family protein n=1 Tax=Candidatus Hakubella thermalkaliphila TaxID=2754717 RepID=A0A6V8PG77_9ACTN|nr:glycosyltransferase 2 family protein [Candidatus Hakubella thermalkaliphila]